MVKNPPTNAGHTRHVGAGPGSGRAARVGNGNLLQYSCLENSMDRGAWWAPGVTKSQTPLSGWAHTLKTKLYQLSVLPINRGSRPHAPSLDSWVVPNFPACTVTALCPRMCTLPGPLPWDIWGLHTALGVHLETTQPLSPSCWCSLLSLYGKRAAFLIMLSSLI